jgi:hypothetical protein
MGQVNTLPTDHKDRQQNETRYHGSGATDQQGPDAQDKSQSDVIQAIDSSQLTLDRFVKQRPHPASIMASMKSNKRFRKPD